MSKDVMLQQQDLFAADSLDTRTLRELCRSLPALPSALRYYDEFDDTVRSIKNPADLVVFEISVFGKSKNINFERLGEESSGSMRRSQPETARRLSIPNR